MHCQLAPPNPCRIPLPTRSSSPAPPALSPRTQSAGRSASCLHLRSSSARCWHSPGWSSGQGWAAPQCWSAQRPLWQQRQGRRRCRQRSWQGCCGRQVPPRRWRRPRQRRGPPRGSAAGWSEEEGKGHVRGGCRSGAGARRAYRSVGAGREAYRWPCSPPLLEKLVALLHPLTLKSQWPCSLNLRAVLELLAPDAFPAAASEPLGYMCWRRGAIMALTLPPLAVMSYEHPHWGLEGRRAARSRGAAGQGWDCSGFGSRQASCCSFAFAALPKVCVYHAVDAQRRPPRVRACAPLTLPYRSSTSSKSWKSSTGGNGLEGSAEPTRGTRLSTWYTAPSASFQTGMCCGKGAGEGQGQVSHGGQALICLLCHIGSTASVHRGRAHARMKQACDRLPQQVALERSMLAGCQGRMLLTLMPCTTAGTTASSASPLKPCCLE